MVKTIEMLGESASFIGNGIMRDANWPNVGIKLFASDKNNEAITIRIILL